MLDKLIDIKSKMDSLKPFSDGFKAIYENLNLLDFAYMNLKLDGSNLTKEGVNEIIKGEVIDHVSLMEHQEVVHHKEILKTMNDMLQMDMELDEKQITRLYKSLTGKENISFRSDTSILYHLDYMPSAAATIEDELKDVFIQVFKIDYKGDFIKRAISIHNRIVKVYPFKDENECLARIAMEYELMRNGMPVIPFELSESDYNCMLGEYLSTGEEDPLYENLMFSAVSKLNILIGLLEDEY